jgi:phosphomannomutase
MKKLPKLCMNVNCTSKPDLEVLVKVYGGSALRTRVCFKHIRKALAASQADFVLSLCVPVKKVAKK